MKEGIIKLKKLLLIPAMILGMTSCIQFKQLITIDANNKGTLKIDLTIDDKLYQELQQTDYVKYFDSSFGEKQYTEARGFKIYRYRAEHNKDSHTIKIDADIIDFDKAIKSGLLGAFIHQRYDSGNELYYKFKFLNERQQNLSADKLKGLEIQFDIKCEKVISTNAQKKEKGHVSWRFNQHNFKKNKDAKLYLKYSD